MTLSELRKRWDAFQPKLPDWRRVDGQRLLITPSGYGVRENGESGLVIVSKEDFIVGRDERRMTRALARACSEATWGLERVMEVPRECVLGKTASLQCTQISAKECRGRIADGRFIKPDFMFVTYQAKDGRRLRFRVFGDV